MEIDKIIHEPARLRIMMILSGVESADFNFLWKTLAMTKGNLSSHMDRLEKADYIKVDKGFNGRVPHTDYQLTETGNEALENYWAKLDEIRKLSELG